jgi:hypothetical protein
MSGLPPIADMMVRQQRNDALCQLLPNLGTAANKRGAPAVIGHYSITRQD